MNTNKNIYGLSLGRTPNILPYCKVCHDAGKSAEIYNSHFIRKTRDPNSPVVCPTLLNQQCRYCKQSGHTTKYCPILSQKYSKQEQKEYKKTHYVKPQSTPQTLTQTPHYKNIYDVFILYDDDDNHDKISSQELKEDEIILTPNPIIPTPIITQNPTQPIQKTYAQVILQTQTLTQTLTQTNNISKIHRPYPLKYVSNWADRKSTRLNSSHSSVSRMPSSA